MEFIHTSLSQQVAKQKADGSLPAAVGPSDSSDAGAVTTDAGAVTTDEGDSGTVYYEGQTEVTGANVSGTSKKLVKHPKLPDKPLDFQVKIAFCMEGYDVFLHKTWIGENSCDRRA